MRCRCGGGGSCSSNVVGGGGGGVGGGGGGDGDRVLVVAQSCKKQFFFNPDFLGIQIWRKKRINYDKFEIATILCKSHFFLIFCKIM